jgi:SAM-dependent methyltransferase
MDISGVVQEAHTFRDKLAAIKAAIGQSEFGWYPYDSLSNFNSLQRVLKGQFRTILDELKGARVLDIGAADGELAFFLESKGFSVTAIDHPFTNFNGMRGIRKLKEALHSNVEIISADLDSRFDFPAGQYDLVFFLGILYHLKNPYYILDLLAQRARFCFLSTRVARFTPDRVAIQKLPVAYLLGPDELNHDWTNYWIFSDAGLKRLLYRTGWEICSYGTIGDTERSRPDTMANDERALCLIRNRRLTDPGLTVKLLKGWHELEEHHWRWTERRFSVEIPLQDPDAAGVLELEFVYPDPVKERIGLLRLNASIEGAPLPETEYRASGPHVYRATVPPRQLRKPTLLVEFELNQAIPPDAGDLRERGIIVSNIGLR